MIVYCHGGPIGGVTYGLFSLIRRRMTFRVPADVELEGLDRPEFGAVAYPEFVLAPTAGLPARAPSAESATAPSSDGHGAQPNLFDIRQELVEETARRVLELVRTGDEGT